MPFIRREPSPSQGPVDETGARGASVRTPCPAGHLSPVDQMWWLASRHHQGSGRQVKSEAKWRPAMVLILRQAR